jgi:hypothetical protein
LHRLQVTDYLLGIGLLFIDDALEHVKLLVNLLGDLFLEAFLVKDAMLHLGAFAEIVSASFIYLLELLDMLVGCLL